MEDSDKNIVYVFVDQKEIKNMDKYPILSSPNERAGSADEKDMTLEERKESRRNIIPSRLNRVLKRNAGEIRKLGQAFAVSSESALNDLKKQFIFVDQNGKEVNFLMEFKTEGSDLPTSVNELLEKYQLLLEENAKLKLSGGKPSKFDEKQVKKNFYDYLSAQMLVGFTKINNTLGLLTDLSDDLGKSQKETLIEIKKEIQEGLLHVRNIMMKIEGEVS